MTGKRPFHVVGAGPNGLVAAITLAQDGHRVTLHEAGATVGGGARTAELTLPGFRHDVCSTIDALAPLSPVLRALPLERYGAAWVRPEIPMAQPLDDGTAILLHDALDATADQFPAPDAGAWRSLFGPLVDHQDDLWQTFLGPLPGTFRHPLLAAQFGVRALWPIIMLAHARFRDPGPRALLASCAAHSFLDLSEPGTSAMALMLAISAYGGGWPFARGGSQTLSDALAALLRDLGGEVVTDHRINSLRELPEDTTVLFDLTPRQILRIAGDALPARYRWQLGRYRYGPAAFKLDWALDGPIPWTAADVRRAGTVHLGGQMAEIAASERAVNRGSVSPRPFVLLTQPTIVDPSRAPAGQHTAWAYCHVPSGWSGDMTAAIEDQVERFAPGFRDRIIGRHVINPAAFAAYNADYIGGDINGGRQDLRQQFFRPTPSLNPYATANPRLFICSASTPPGGGIHGMAGYHGALAALRRTH